MTHQNQNQHKRRTQRNPPNTAAIDMGDATLTAMREALTIGQITTNSSNIMKKLFNDGHQFERHEVELMFSNLHGRALQILVTRMSPEMYTSTYGQMLVQSWQSVALREVIYALSTAHPMCLRVFRVFKGKVEWIGDDSHRATPKDTGVSEEKSTSTDDMEGQCDMSQQVCEDDWTPPRRITGEEGEGRGY